MSEIVEKCDETKRLPTPSPGDEVVISGIAGRFPDSDNVQQLQENLCNGVDLITEDDRRWKLDDPEIPKRCGKINNVEKFDSLFFGVHFKQAHTMDPMCRIFLETAYEAIVDAGVNPRQLRGTNTGVFIGACFSETEKTFFYERRQVNGFGISGCSRAMLANRISFWLGCTGPSYSVDTACSSSLFALDHAYTAIRNGQCEAALVGGANLCLHPYVALQFARLGVLSPDGRCKSFDADADGYCRSEAIPMILLQRAKDARRIYANVVHTKVNCDGFKEQGITFPSSIMQSTLLQQCYEECGVPPSSVAYVEAHGTGTAVGDPEEVNAIERVFCPGRTTPLRIGSVKTNLGHSEPASGLCSIAKVLIAMERGCIPPNLHYKRPRVGVKALEEGRIQVITNLTPWDGGYVGVNSFGFGGANAHVLLKSNTKEKINGGIPGDDLPRLVVVSGRNEEAVATMLNDLESRPVDVEYISLFHNIYAEEITGHLHRGYTILPPRGLPENEVRHAQSYPGAKRPIWFVFSGMGSQWAGMGEALLKIPVFTKAIQKCDAVLKIHGVDIIDILTNKNPKTFDNILNCFVGIAAVQIGLVDVLASVGIVADNIIGHSLGELGCAYADGCFTAEEMILVAHIRGVVSLETELIHGSMAAVGLGYNELKHLCPPDIEIACHNGPKSSTISGPTKPVERFVAELQAKNIFAKEVPCANIAYHSRYIAAAAPKFLACLQKVVPKSKPRSPKWLSTSVPRKDWGSSSAQLCSPEYHTNNLLNPVLFEETSQLIPHNAITIEIAPHGLLQAILRRSLHENVSNIPLTKRGHENNVEYLLQGIGKMYEVGLHPQLTNLYPKVDFPVSRGTPMISPLVRWEHSEDWYVTSYSKQEKVVSGERIVQMSVTDVNFEWMAGHVIDRRNLLPATGYLELIWETVGLMQGKLFTEVSVVFEDVRFHRATTLPKDGSVELTLMIHKGSGRFEIIEGGTAVVSGLIRVISKASQERLIVSDNILLNNDEDEDLCLTARDIYKEFRLRGYQYTGLFRGLKAATVNGTKGRIEWQNNWVTFMDNMLQMQILGMDTRRLLVPTRIQKLVIDTKAHSSELRSMPDEDKAFTVRVHRDLDIIVSGGVEIRGLKASAITRRRPAGVPVLENFKFVAHRDQSETSLSVITRAATDIALENHSDNNIKTLEVIREADDTRLENLTSPLIYEILSNLPLLIANVSVIAPGDKISRDALPSHIQITDSNKLSGESGALLVVSHGIFVSEDIEMLKQIQAVMSDAGFLLAREPLNVDSGIVSTMSNRDFGVVMEKRTGTEIVILFRKIAKLPPIYAVISISNKKFSWLFPLQTAMKKISENRQSLSGRILLVSEGDYESGLMGLVNCLRKEPGGEAVQGLLIQDLRAPKFSLESPFYSEQLKLGLTLNVLRPGKLWGSYRFFHMDPPTLQPVYHTQLCQLTRGDLSATKWMEGRIQPNVGKRNTIKVHYASINFRDIMLLTGKLAPQINVKSRVSGENMFGFEYSGRDENGRAVMGMVENGSFSNLCVSDKELLWPVPDGWTLEDAATVPVVYGTVYYALFMCGNMKKGDKVLIHAGSGGVGQAAITLALHEGCEVFTTVGTQQKRDFIKKQFAEIDDDHIGNSRDTSFEQLVLWKTQGRGVDIVLNSLAEEKLQASVRCLASRGRFLEIGKFDLDANNSLGMGHFSKEISFQAVLLDTLFSETSELKSRLAKILAQGIKSGAVKPLNRTVFEMNEAEAAFRYMAAGKHIGKVILKIRDEPETRKSPLPLALPRYSCVEERSYLILGGLGGFGLELADWLVLRGARKLVLTSRIGISNGYQRSRMNIWKSYGVKVLIVIGKDASTHEGCEAVLKAAVSLGPVDGIFNLAVVLKDGMIENQTVESFEESFRVKAWATKQLDKLSRTMCPHLRQFVVFSSVSCGRGNLGQSNYGMANSVMERICETRATENLPGLAVQWGAVGDVGLIAEMQQDGKEIVIGGTLQQGILSCLNELDGFLQQESPVVSSMVVAEKTSGSGGALNILDAVINIMGLKDLKTLSIHTPLTELGMDSMMVVEIKQMLEREFEVFMTPQDVRGLTFEKIQEISQHKENEETEDRNEKTITAEPGDLSGLKILIRTLGKTHINKDICVPMMSKSEGERRVVFMLPGIEGTHNVFQSLASKLRSQTTCLQLGPTLWNLTSIEEMVNQLIPHVRARSKGQKGIVVVGYSYGSVLAIEIVRRLEKEDFDGRLVLIDGAPDYIKALATQHLTTNTDDELQSVLLFDIMNILAPTFGTKLLEELQNCITWEDKLTAFTKTLPEDKNLDFTLEDQKAMCSAIYYRIKALLKYDFSALAPIRTPITLLKPKILSLSMAPEDYGLGSLTSGGVDVHYVEGDHVTMLDADACAAAINGDVIMETALDTAIQTSINAGATNCGADF
ncbi:fatty acid synthase-like [Neodiprion virginianus]|uniref:fatty acid synthase-like n=1 Tax=Neodiprion virginianus TaxID=2961670 RepID=UPI001EE6F4DB|nr:fatty acid synthase-like [Neodiprion virginianus]